jgi:hypothetical protein
MFMPDIGFLIIGAEKTGSTSLFKYMQRHPQVHMPAEKELHFFNVDRAYSRGWNWYSKTVLRGAPPDAICGEAGQYMIGAPHVDRTSDKHADSVASSDDNGSLEEVVPRRIRQFLPDVKLICVLRDPVARAYSEYRMGVLDRVESRSFDEAIEQLMEPGNIGDARITHTRTNGYVVSGEYYRILAGFLRFFSREQLLVIFSNELSDRPVETLATVFEFIGVEPDFVPDNLNTRYRTAAVKQRISGLNLFIWRENLVRFKLARTFWHVLPSSVKTSVNRTYNVIGNRTALWNARRGSVDDDMSSSTRRRLIAYFRSDSEALGDMLQSEIPWLEDWARS